MHPTQPQLQGKDLSDTKDPTGKRLFVEFTHIVKAEGAGFVDYLWPQPGKTEPVAKISYVQGFAPWGWLIGSGIYIDDVARMRVRLKQVVEHIAENANQLANASSQVSATAQSLSQSTSEEAASVEETSASVEQMAALIEQNKDNARATETIAVCVAAEAASGGKVVRETTEAMRLIAAQEIGRLASGSVGKANEAARLLEEIVPSISKTASLVKEIAAASED